MDNDYQEQALYKLSQILQGDNEARRKFERMASLATFKFQGLGRMLGMWKSNQNKDMTCIQLFGQHWLLQNLRIALLKEAARVGPQRYCIVFNRASNFFSKLKMILAYLPLEKMFLYPAQESLGGPFLQEPWLSQGQLLCSHPSISLEEYMPNFRRTTCLITPGISCINFF